MFAFISRACGWKTYSGTAFGSKHAREERRMPILSAGATVGVSARKTSLGLFEIRTFGLHLPRIGQVVQEAGGSTCERDTDPFENEREEDEDLH